jgi:hypothetical protein
MDTYSYIVIVIGDDTSMENIIKNPESSLQLSYLCIMKLLNILLSLNEKKNSRIISIHKKKKLP